MDRALKERIIGAIVLVAVVVLVVPVFLDGPPEESGIVSERISLPGQESDGTRTIVLDRDRSEPVPQERPAQPAPGTVAPAPGEATAEAARDEAASSESAPPAATLAARSEAPDPVADEPVPAAATRVEEPESRTRSSTGMWAVQLGSFSNEANAERLAADLRQQGFAAFLSKLTTDSGELHRVRVGPQRDRESAETMLARLERAGQKGQVVPHP